MGVKKNGIGINILPFLNFILLVSILAFLVFYIIQMNLIYSSEATIEEYKNELVIYREKFSELNNNPGAIYNSDMVEVKNRLNMVEGRIISSIKVSPSEVALSN